MSRSTLSPLLFLALAVLTLSCKERISNDLAEQGLRAKVRSVLTTYYAYPSPSDSSQGGDALGNKALADATLTYVDSTIYDEAGYMLASFMTYHEDDDIIDRRYEADSANSDVTSMHPKYFWAHRLEFRRNASGQILEQKAFYHDKLEDQVINTYNEAGLLLESKQPIHQIDTCARYTRYTYDDKARLIREYDFRGDDPQPVEISYSYNAQGLCTQKALRSGEEVSTEIYIYDAQGRLSQVRASYADVWQYSQHFTYDDKGRKISEEHQYANKSRALTTYRYDEQDNILEEYVQSFSSEGASTHEERKINEYTYDAQGNWTRCMSYIDDGSARWGYFLRLRRIAYY